MSLWNKPREKELEGLGLGATVAATCSNLAGHDDRPNMPQSSTEMCAPPEDRVIFKVDVPANRSLAGLRSDRQTLAWQAALMGLYRKAGQLVAFILP